MSSSPLSTESICRKYTHCAPSRRHHSKRHHLKLAEMDEVLAGEGAWTQGSPSGSSAQMADCIGENPGEELFDEPLMLAGNWTRPSSIQCARAQGPLANIETTRNDEFHHATLQCANNGRYPSAEFSAEEHFAACQLTSTSIAGFHLSNHMTNDEVDHWLPSTPGHRFAVTSIVQGNGSASCPQNSTRERDVLSSSWVFVAATSVDVDSHIQDMQTYHSLPFEVSLDTWLQVDREPMAGFNRLAQ